MMKISKRISEKVQPLSFIHWLALLIPIAITGFAWLYATSVIKEKNHLIFQQQATHITDLLEERFHVYEDGLIASAAYLQSHSGYVTANQWSDFAKNLNITQRYEGVMGIGVIYKVKQTDLPEYLARQNANRSDFQIHPMKERQVYWPITYIEPVQANKQAVGLDMAHETNRLTAAIAAEQEGSAKITGPITLVQDQSKTPGFLFYFPFYDTPNTDQAEFVGLVYSPLVVKQFVAGALKNIERHVNLQIIDDGKVIFDEHNIDVEATEYHFNSSIKLPVYGRSWTLNFVPTATFDEKYKNYLPTAILIFGLLVSSFFMLFLLNLINSNRKTSQALRSVTKAHKSYIDASGDGYWDWYIQDDYEYMSPRFWQIFGFESHEKEHKPSAWQDLIFEEDLEVALENFNQHVKTKGQHPYVQEVRYKHKNGSTVTVLCRGKVIEWKGDVPIRMVGTHTDISELKHIESKLRQANQELEEFAFRTSHDLRSPLLSSIKMMDIIQREIDDDNLDKAKRYIDIVQHSMVKLEALVKDLLRLTQLNHKGELELASVNQIIKKSVEKLHQLEGAETLSINLDIKASEPVFLPELHTSVIIENLLSNAIKYQDIAINNSEVDIVTRVIDGQILQIEVTDNGIGIEPKHHKDVFEMFKRFHPSTSFGSGLGLYIVKKSVELLGGTVQLEPRLIGTKFILEIPIKN